MAVAGALAAWPALSAGRAVGWVDGLGGGLAVLILAAGLRLQWPNTVPAAIGLLGLEYASFLALEDVPLDQRAPLYAAGLLAVAELSYWSLELRAAVTDEPGSHWRRAAFVAWLCLLSLALGAGLLALVDVGVGGGLALEALGALAAAGALAVIAALARRSAVK